MLFYYFSSFELSWCVHNVCKSRDLVSFYGFQFESGIKHNTGDFLRFFFFLLNDREAEIEALCHYVTL